MKNLLEFLHRYRWMALTIAIVALAVWIVVVGFGETLGVDAGVRESVGNVSVKIWGFFTTAVVAPLLRDKDGDGKIAAVDEDDSDPEL